MGLGGILQELKREGVLALYHDYRSGRLVDWSGNGNSGTLSGTGVNFTKKGAITTAGNYIAVPYSASATWTTQMSFVVMLKSFGLLTSLAAGYYALYVTTGVTQLIRLSGTAFGFNDGTNFRTVTADLNNKSCVGISVSNGATGRGYLDGVDVGALSGNSIVGGPAGGTIDILRPVGIALFPVICNAAVLVKRVLTSTEHSRLYGQLARMNWNTKGLGPGPMMP